MTRTGTVTLSMAVVASALAVGGAIYTGLTTHEPVWNDVTGERWAVAAIGALLAVLYALLAVGLLRAAPAIDGSSRATRTVRIALAADLGPLSCIFVIGLLRTFNGGLLDTAAGVAFLLLFLLAAILGGMTLRRSELRMPALLLLSPVVIIPALILVGIWFPNWSDPALAEAALYLGLALLGTRNLTVLPARPLARANHP